MKKILFILLYIVLFLLILSGIGFFAASRGLKELQSMKINEINLSGISDGEYTGTFSKYRWNFNVKVTVNDHKITEIKLLNENDKNPMKSLNDKIIKAIIEKQQVNIDAVSGASVNTKTLSKAVQNALERK